MNDLIEVVVPQLIVAEVVVPPPIVIEVGPLYGDQGGGGGITDGDKGGIIVSGGGATWLVKDGSISDLMLGASAIALFAAASHTHFIANITGLQEALDGKQAALGFTPENAAQKGVAGGYAGLDGTGKVPAAQLPAYVDDVVEVANFAALPVTGETGKIYVTLDTNKTWRWSGSAYLEISPSPGSTDSVTEGATNLYFTAARVRVTDLTGYAAAGSRVALAAGDTILGAFGKLGKWVADLSALAFSGNASDLSGTKTSSFISDFAAAVAALITGKQDTLVSGTNVKTINGNSVLGSGNLVVSAAPGGSTGEMQYNNAGAFAGAADVEVEGGQLRLPEISTPTTPVSGGIKFYARRAGLILLAFLADSGQEMLVQPSIARQHMAMWYPQGNGTTVVNLGLSPSFSGTATTQNVATTSFYTLCARIGYLVTVAATNAVAEWRMNFRKWTVGGTRAGEGGFTMTLRFGCSTGVATATTRLFAGFRTDGNPATDVNPSGFTTGIVCFGWDSGDANAQIMHRGPSVVTKVDLGTAFARPTVNNTDVFEVVLSSPPGTTKMVYYEVTRLNTGAKASGVITTNLPAATDLGNADIYYSVGGTSSVIGLSIMKVSIESTT